MRRSLGGINNNRHQDVEEDSENKAADDQIQLAIALAHHASERSTVMFERLTFLLNVL